MTQNSIADTDNTAVERSVRSIQAAFDNGDADTLRGLMTEDHVSTMTYARFSSAAELLEALPDYQFSEYLFSELKAQLLTPDVALAWHQATIKGTYKGREVPSPVKVTTVWVKRGGKWRQASYQETPVPRK
jgi:uncharacterized protein (TIGR02246 family)